MSHSLFRLILDNVSIAKRYECRWIGIEVRTHNHPEIAGDRLANRITLDVEMHRVFAVYNGRFMGQVFVVGESQRTVWIENERSDVAAIASGVIPAAW